MSLSADLGGPVGSDPSDGRASTGADEPEEALGVPSPAALGLGFFALYLVTGLSHSGAALLTDFPLGADTPFYVDLFRSPPEVNMTVYSKHPLTVGLAWAMGRLASPLGNPAFAANLLFAALGTLNLLAAAGVFRALLGARRALLPTLVYGLSGAIWFFASYPESYGTTTLLGSAYLLLLVRNLDGDSWQTAGARALVLFLGTLNEIVFPLILVIPLLLHGTRLLRDRSLLLKEALQPVAAGALSLVVLLLAVQDFPGMYLWRAEVATEVNAVSDVAHTAMDFLFFSFGFPAAAADVIRPSFPEYEGFFGHGPGQYLARAAGPFFLVLHAGLAVAVLRAARDELRWVVALGAYVVGRIVIIAVFNADEAILYTAPSVLPIAVLMALSLRHWPTSRYDLVFAAYLLTLLGLNAPFFLNTL